MAIADWNPDLSVGVDELDADHRRLIETMNAVFEALLLGTSSTATHQALVTLNEYVIDHFRREEAWMAANGYSGLAEHQKEHLALREHVQRLSDMERQFPNEVTLELLIVLRDWLLGHIAHSDRNAALAEHQVAQDEGQQTS